MAGPSKKHSSKTIRPKFNSTPMMDIRTGRFEQGKDGLFYLNGGVPHIVGYAGRGNTFKSALSGTIACIISLRYRFEYTEFYDTEMSMQPARIQDYIDSVAASHHWDEIPKISDLMMSDDNTWNFVASDQLIGDQWWETHCREPLKERSSIKEAKQRCTPFRNLDGSWITMPNPWKFVVDSISELHTGAAMKKIDSTTVGQSEQNTLFMDDARHKAQLIGQMPNVAAQGNYYFSMVAHADDELKMDMYAPSQKKLDGLKGNLKLKGVPGRAFTFLTNSCLLATGISNGLHPKEKTCMYPHPDAEDIVGDSDLRIVTYTELRGKSGPTGSTFDVVFSQREGFLPGVTEFHYLNKDLSGWGLEKSGIGGSIMRLDLYPDVSFTRKTLRDKLMTDRKFSRAMGMTATLAYMHHHWFDMEKDERMSMKELRQAITDQGYDWDELLARTVDYWYFNDLVDTVGMPTITVKTLLWMALGKLKPSMLTCSPPKVKTA